VTVAVEITVAGTGAVTLGAEMAEKLRALATTLAEESDSTDVTVNAALVLSGGHPRPPRNQRPDSAPVQILAAERTVLLDGDAIEFTRREFDLLLFLARQPGRVYTRSQLMQAVWGLDYISGERTVDVHIRRIRAKLRGQESLVSTVRGVGYRLAGSADVMTGTVAGMR
jgi:DNA-binding response OmpR family regulator